jgi:transposase-like protein
MLAGSSSNASSPAGRRRGSPNSSASPGPRCTSGSAATARKAGTDWPTVHPKLRSGSYVPDWLLERRRCAERALTTEVATCYLLGVSTWRMEKLVELLGITRLSKSQVSTMAAELDAHVADFRGRPLDQGPYTFVVADALVLKVREGGRVVNVHALLPTGSTPTGTGRSSACRSPAPRTAPGWIGFVRDLTARGRRIHRQPHGGGSHLFTDVADGRPRR